MTNHYDYIIIGAGHNGLVAGAYLAKQGKQVLVLERRAIVGGSVVADTAPAAPTAKVVAAAATKSVRTWVRRMCITRRCSPLEARSASG